MGLGREARRPRVTRISCCDNTRAALHTIYSTYTNNNDLFENHFVFFWADGDWELGRWELEGQLS